EAIHAEGCQMIEAMPTSNVLPMLGGDGDDDIIAVAPELAPLLDCETVDAVCVSVEKKHFATYHRPKLIFNFSVIEPEMHAGTELQMFMNIDERWRKGKMAKSSKLFKCALIACGSMVGRQPIRYSTFTKKVFRCALRTAISEAGQQYSVIDILLEKL